MIKELHARDERDRTRANSPLVAARDAVTIDSTQLTLDQVMQQAIDIIDARLAELKND